MTQVRAKKALGQHFLTDESIAVRITESLSADSNVGNLLEIGPGMGVLTKHLESRKDLDFRAVEIDGESVDYLLSHYPSLNGRIIFGDFLKLPVDSMFD